MTQQIVNKTPIEESIKRLNDTTNIKRLNKEADDLLAYLKLLENRPINENK